MSDILIIGPTNSGKTYLANFLATFFSVPVFNCDSVQIYKYLDCLTSKPRFAKQEYIQESTLSKTELFNEIDLHRYSNIEVEVIKNENGALTKHSFELSNLQKLLQVIDWHKNPAQDFVENYLFDIKEPGESYSSFEFNKDVESISKKFDICQKIIVGGTIYYVYNYLFQIAEEKTKSVERKESNFENKSYLEILKEFDPKALDVIDLKNPRRIETAAKFVMESGRKYSSEYFRPHNLRDNFILIILKPKDRKQYYKELDQVVDERFNIKTFEEIDFLIKKYGGDIVEWLKKVSYEYKYFLQIYSILKENGVEYSSQNPLRSQEIDGVLQTLKYKEHQYTKRQMTFIRRLERKIQNGRRISSPT